MNMYRLDEGKSTGALGNVGGEWKRDPTKQAANAMSNGDTKC